MSSDNTDRLMHDLAATLESWLPPYSWDREILYNNMLAQLEAIIGLPRTQWTR